MKRFWLIAAAAALILLTYFALPSKRGNLPRPDDTNLDFWIAENVDDVDFSKFVEKPGYYGGKEYYGTGYSTDDDACCVLYTITSFPDYYDLPQHVTHISITDPKVSVYGIHVGTSSDEFKRIVKEQGFEITESNENFCLAVKGDYSISLNKNCLRIRVEVTNKHKITY